MTDAGDGPRGGEATTAAGPPRLGPRLVLAVGFLFGLVYLAFVLAVGPWQVGIDFEVYYVAAKAALAGENFYAVAPERVPSFTYVYPPLSILLFFPYAVFGSWVPGFAIHTLGTVLAGLATAWLLVRYVERAGDDRLQWLDRALVAGFVVASIHAMPSLVFGQVNHHVALALTAGFVALDRNRESVAGGAFAAAAFFKVFPAAVGVWLLRRRAWRAIAAAITTGLGLLALGLVAFGPELTAEYLHVALLDRLDHGQFLGGLDPTATYLTLRRPLSVLFPQGPSLLWAAGALAVLAPPVAYCYRAIDGRLDRLVAIQATLLAILLFFPSYPIYVVILLFPLVPLLYLLPAGGPRRLVVGGALLANASVRLDDVAQILGALPLDPDLGASVVSAVEPLFTVATPPLVGLLLVLAGCVWYRYETDVASGGD
ncbi:glycosyltransferase 87 family protein [Halorientalis halophila]|uniref:glycosyltransferase 87 family protein n=1 Tax=Halorientalis halophila TaxID=3108499 RepID=UPI00300A79F7